MIAKMVLGSTHLAYLPADFGDRLEEKKEKEISGGTSSKLVGRLCVILVFLFFSICSGLYRWCVFFSLSLCVVTST